MIAQYAASGQRAKMPALQQRSKPVRYFFQNIAELMGPVLNMSSPQGRHAPAILNLFTEVLLRDTDYIERIKRHYRLFRATLDKV